MTRSQLYLVLIPFLTLSAACGKESESTPTITLTFGTYTASYRALNQLANFLLPSAWAASSEIKLCFKRIRFKSETDSTSSSGTDSLDFQVGEISLSKDGSSLGSLAVPAGIYRRVEFDLGKDGAGCTSGRSVQFANSNGSYWSDDTITIKFESSAGFSALSSGQVLAFGTQSIIDALNGVSGSSGKSSSLKSALEAASVKGTF